MVITSWKVKLWTGGGVKELVLETPNLVRLLFRTTPISVPNFIILEGTVHKAAFDSHWGGIIKIKKTNRYNQRLGHLQCLAPNKTKTKQNTICQAINLASQQVRWHITQQKIRSLIGMKYESDYRMYKHVKYNKCILYNGTYKWWLYTITLMITLVPIK